MDKEQVIVEWERSKEDKKGVRALVTKQALPAFIKAALIGTIIIVLMWVVLNRYLAVPGEKDYWNDIFLRAALYPLIMVPVLFIAGYLNLLFGSTKYILTDRGIKKQGDNARKWKWENLSSYKIHEYFFNGKVQFGLELKRKQKNVRPVYLPLPNDVKLRQVVIDEIASRLGEDIIIPQLKNSLEEKAAASKSIGITALIICILTCIFARQEHFKLMGQLDCLDVFGEFARVVFLILCLIIGPGTISLLINIRKLAKYKDLMSTIPLLNFFGNMAIFITLMIKYTHGLLELVK
jgi:riboflavin transporter FmnP